MRVVVQQRQRFLRDGLGRVLDGHADIDVVGTVATAFDLIQLCEDHRPDVVLLEVDTPEGDPGRVATRLRRRTPLLRVIGMDGLEPEESPSQSRRWGMQAVIPRGGGSRSLLEAIRNTGAMSRAHSVPTIDVRRGVDAETRRLTAREMTVLTMVAGGWTSREMSSELQISVKTVENHKQKIFAKLGVQNQAHAVSLAMRQGILAPEQVVEVSAG